MNRRAALSSARLGRAPRNARRGAIFITALWIVLILGGLVLVFAQDMRTEAITSANELSYAQADAVEQGAENWVCAQIETYPADAITITQQPAEAIPVGSGYFWILTPNPNTDQTYQFGITDEASKLNLNTVTSDELQLLPNMTEPIADAIVDWRSPAASATPDGAESDYYSTLPEGYDAKNAPYETVEELMLVRDVTPDVMFGLDLNHDGVVDDLERAAGSDSAAMNFSSPNGTNRGIFNDLTCYSVEPNKTISGGPRINVNSTNTNPLLNYLTTTLSGSRATAIIARVRPLVRAARGGQAFSSIGRFYQISGLSIEEFSEVADNLTTSSAKTLTGLVNVNTAPLEVLECLPNIQESDAEAIVAYRQTMTDSDNIGWIFNAVSSSSALRLARYITARSFIYSADIVAVSGDGRSFKRVRIVVDSRQYPSKIIYRKDLTSLGWPLPAEIRTAMRAGKAPPVGLSGGGLNFGH